MKVPTWRPRVRIPFRRPWRPADKESSKHYGPYVTPFSPSWHAMDVHDIQTVDTHVSSTLPIPISPTSMAHPRLGFKDVGIINQHRRML